MSCCHPYPQGPQHRSPWKTRCWAGVLAVLTAACGLAACLLSTGDANVSMDDQVTGGGMNVLLSSAQADIGDVEDPVRFGPEKNGFVTFITSNFIDGVGVLDARMNTVMYMKSNTLNGDMMEWEMVYFPSTATPWTVIYKDASGTWNASRLEITPGHLKGADQPTDAFSLDAPAGKEVYQGPYGGWTHHDDLLAYGVRLLPFEGGSSVSAILEQSDGARSGPSTEYSEWGTFLPGGQAVNVVSYTYDQHNAPWVQLEYTSDRRHSRSYTLYMRLLGAPPLSSLPREYPLGRVATVLQETVPFTGPGLDYEQYRTMKLLPGRQGTAIAAEGDWLMIDFPGVGDAHIFRVWVQHQSVQLT